MKNHKNYNLCILLQKKPPSRQPTTKILCEKKKKMLP